MPAVRKVRRTKRQKGGLLPAMAIGAAGGLFTTAGWLAIQNALLALALRLGLTALASRLKLPIPSNPWIKWAVYMIPMVVLTGIINDPVSNHVESIISGPATAVLWWLNSYLLKRESAKDEQARKDRDTLDALMASQERLRLSQEALLIEQRNRVVKAESTAKKVRKSKAQTQVAPPVAQ